MKRALFSFASLSFGVVAAFALATLAVSCGGSVDTATAGAAGGAGGAGCSGPQVQCADACGSDYFPASADCKGGEWVCPPDTVDPSDCPAGTCWGPPLACETCGESGWECKPDAACTASCSGIVCAVCPADKPGETLFGGCSCKCDAAGQYTCSPAPDCCTTDMQCGDESFVACSNGVCKQPVTDGCWSDTECPPGMICEGESVCPCGFDCLLPDMPGMCVPG